VDHCGFDRGRVLNREQLIDAAWRRDTFITGRVVDTHVLNLRKKTEPVPAKPRHILSGRGMGYRFDVPDFPRAFPAR
jgi:two-component system response regulator RegX3